MMPDTLNAFTPFLPTSMAIELIGPLFLSNQLSADAPWAAAGLVLYATLFAALAAKQMRWRA
jgi:hypothetical protein